MQPESRENTGIQILVVEDDASIRTLLAMMLRGAVEGIGASTGIGHVEDETGNGAAAFHAYFHFNAAFAEQGVVVYYFPVPGGGDVQHAVVQRPYVVVLLEVGHVAGFTHERIFRAVHFQVAETGRPVDTAHTHQVAAERTGCVGVFEHLGIVHVAGEFVFVNVNTQFVPSVLCRQGDGHIGDALPVVLVFTEHEDGIVGIETDFIAVESIHACRGARHFKNQSCYGRGTVQTDFNLHAPLAQVGVFADQFAVGCGGQLHVVVSDRPTAVVGRKILNIHYRHFLKAFAKNTLVVESAVDFVINIFRSRSIDERAYLSHHLRGIGHDRLSEQPAWHTHQNH